MALTGALTLTIFLILLALVGAVYVFLKSNAKRGTETVRAHVFLGGLHAGASVEEANYVASLDVADGPTDVIHSAIAHLKAEYQGKQLRMIAEAYRRGMRPELPLWYRTLAALQGDDLPRADHFAS